MKRKVVEEAKGLTEKAACRFLFNQARKVPSSQVIVELGAFKGRTTGWLCLGAFEGNGALVIAVDPWTDRSVDDWPEGYTDGQSHKGVYAERQTLDEFDEHMRRCGITADQLKAIKGFATKEGEGYTGPPVGLLFHDAEHTADGVEADLRAWVDHVAPGGMVVLHDAGNPGLGVMEGARRVFEGNDDWDWEGRELRRWRKRPHRRGILIVGRVK